MSYYKRLKKDLKECAEKGIITDLQAQESYNFIYSKKKKFYLYLNKILRDKTLGIIDLIETQ
ncbi:MAG: hypothetical protein ACP5SD_06085 [Elusimicrobiales bacterium]|jgi:hypothetical protein|nr:hypothetical protein [Elusimicrobiales bacterium]HOJ85771.1 hypothetical protein [Elusimicrobiales bacterium]HOL61970.1 hypothetical protein [Elusimicrobiales bacterium]HPO94528.1 hypothetical protein [Elusimicrobiales bacterium]